MSSKDRCDNLYCRCPLEQPLPSSMVTVRLDGQVLGNAMGVPIKGSKRKQVWLRLCVLCWSQIADIREQGTGVVIGEEQK